MNNPYLTTALGLTAPAMRKLMAALGPGLWDVASVPGRFTPREIVAHLADWEIIFLGRMQQAAMQPGSPVEAYDEGRRAEEQAYAQTDVAIELSTFEKARAETIAWVRALPAEGFGVNFLHPEMGPMTVADQLSMLLGHDLYHLEQLCAMLPSEKTAATW